MDGAARYKNEPGDHFDQSYNLQNLMGPLNELAQFVLIHEIILRKLQIFFQGFCASPGFALAFPW